MILSHMIITEKIHLKKSVEILIYMDIRGLSEK